MSNNITIDHAKAQQAAAALKANPPKAEDIIKDPKAFLASQGVHISDDLEALIKSKGALKESSAPKQAGTVHIDVT